MFVLIRSSLKLGTIKRQVKMTQKSTSTDAQLGELVLARYRTLRDADAFKFDDSPLLASWYEFMDEHDISDAGLVSHPADDVVFHARWEEDGEIFEELVTVGDLIEARVDDGELIINRAREGDLVVTAFRMEAMRFDLAASPQDERGDLGVEPSRPRGG